MRAPQVFIAVPTWEEGTEKLSDFTESCMSAITWETASCIKEMIGDYAGIMGNGGLRGLVLNSLVSPYSSWYKLVFSI